MKIPESLLSETYLFIGRLHTGSSPRECSVIRKAAEFYALSKALAPVKGSSLQLRRKKLGLSQEEFSLLVRSGVATVIRWEQLEAPSWVGVLLDVLEERRRDEERRDYLGINEEPET